MHVYYLFDFFAFAVTFVDMSLPEDHGRIMLYSLVVVVFHAKSNLEVFLFEAQSISL